MSDDSTYENERVGEREAVADYLRRIADRIGDGEPLPFAPDDAPGAFEATSPVKLGVTCRATDDRTDVRLDLTWTGRSGADTTGESTARGTDGSEPPGGSGRERGTTRRGADTGGVDEGAAAGEMAAPADDLPDPSVGTRNAEKAAHEFDRATHFAGKGKTRAADSRFQEAVRADPADAEIRRRFANFLWRAEEPERALAQFRQAISIDPENVDIRLDVANFRWSQGDSEAATEQFERALELEPDNPDVHSVYGRFLWEERDDVESAVEHLREALELDDEHALAHLNYAVLLRHGGREERAETHYERALELGEGNATVHNEYGHFLWASGDVEEAARHYATARELESGG